MSKTLDRITREANKELARQARIIYSCSTIALWNDFGWRKERINKIYKQSQIVCQECSEAGTDKSLLWMLEEESGIELQLHDYPRSYHEFSYLDPEKWDGHRPSDAELVFIRKQQVRWFGPQLLAALCLALYREEGWAAVRISRYISAVDSYRAQCSNVKSAVAMLESTTGFKMNELEASWNER